MKKQLIVHYIKRSRNNVIVLGILVSVMMIFSLIQIGESIAFRYKNMLLHSFSYDISASSLSSEQYSEVEQFGTERGFQVDWEDNLCSVDVKQYGCPEGILNTRIQGKDGLEWQDGDMPTNAFELAVSSSFTNENNLSVGQEIILPLCFENGEKQEYTFTVTGVYKESGAGEDLLIFYTSPKTTEILQNEGKQTIENAICAYLTLDENSFEAEYLRSIREELCNVVNPRYEEICEKDEEQLSAEEEDIVDQLELCVGLNPVKLEVFQTMSEDKTMFYAILGVAVILAFAMFLLVFNMIHLDSRRRIKDFSMARCLGFNQQHLTGLLACEIVVDIFFGCGLGLLAGNILNHFIAGKIIEYIVGDTVIIVQHWSCYVLSLGISVLAILLANIKMIRNVLRIQPVDGLRQMDDSVITSVKSAKKITKKNYVLQMAFRNIFRNRLKSVAVTCSLIVCLTMLNAVIHTFVSINDMDGGSMFRNTIADCEIHTKESELDWNDSLDVLDGVEHIYRYSTHNTLKCQIEEKIDIPWSGQVYIFDDSLFARLCDEQDELKELALNQPQLIYCKFQEYAVEKIENKGKTFLRDNGCKFDKDEMVTLSYSADHPVIETKISAVLNQFNMDSKYAEEKTNYWIVNKAFAKKYGLDIQYCDHILFDVVTQNSECFSEIKSRYLGENGSFVNFNAEKEESEKQLKGFMVLALYLIVATALTGFVSMSNTVKFNILTRRKENAIIRAIGLPFQTQIKVICLENLLLILAAVCISSLVAIGVNTLITSQIMYQFQVHFVPYVCTLLFAVLIGELTTYVTVRKYGNSKLAEEIRCSE